MPLRVALISAAVAGSLYCGRDEPAPPTEHATGNLIVTITGLDEGVTPTVGITGPSAFNASIEGSDTLDALLPGAYTLTAPPVSLGEFSFTPDPASQTVTVTAGDTASAAIAFAQAALQVRAQEVVSGLNNPVYVIAPSNDPRLFIVEQPGRIRIYKNGALLPTPFLDVTARVTSGGERGLLSMAFDPAYATNGRFYIYYTGAQGDIFVDRHTVSANPDVASTAFTQVITIQHRMAGNHNGGHVMFGPDGMLYLGTGDGGGGGDPEANGQNINSLLGKLLRINVATLPYTIPPNNPFATTAGADEIWAYGLRNPWRFAFDGQGASAQLYIADVGQNAWEEVHAFNANTPGVNYGWRTMEGAHCYNPSSGCNQAGLTLPVLEYSHSQGCSITGGFVYRGAAIPELRGHYFYGDFCGRYVRSFRLSGTTAVDQTSRILSVGAITSFGLDGAGEMYITTNDGRVQKIVRN